MAPSSTLSIARTSLSLCLSSRACGPSCRMSCLSLSWPACLPTRLPKPATMLPCRSGRSSSRSCDRTFTSRCQWSGSPQVSLLSLPLLSLLCSVVCCYLCVLLSITSVARTSLSMSLSCRVAGGLPSGMSCSLSLSWPACLPGLPKIATLQPRRSGRSCSHSCNLAAACGHHMGWSATRSERRLHDRRRSGLGHALGNSRNEVFDGSVGVVECRL